MRKYRRSSLSPTGEYLRHDPDRLDDVHKWLGVRLKSTISSSDPLAVQDTCSKVCLDQFGKFVIAARIAEGTRACEIALLFKTSCMIAEVERSAARDADQLSEPSRVIALQQQLDALRALQDLWETERLDTLPFSPLGSSCTIYILSLTNEISIPSLPGI